jgi:hypothetical protein
MTVQEIQWLDDFLRRVAEFRVAAAIGPATGWDANAPEIEWWHEKYRGVHIPSFFRAYELDRDQLILALEGEALNEGAARRASRSLLRNQFSAWLRGEGVDAADLEAMVAAYNVNPLAGLPEAPVGAIACH